MCNKCGDSEHDDRILKPRKGEMFSINAKQIHNSDVDTVNNFIRFARAVSKRNAKNIIKAHNKLFKK
jgi:hypothetical protein